MKKKYLKIFKVDNTQNHLKWLILTAIAIIFTLSSCANMAMVRANTAKQRQIAKEKNVKTNKNIEKNVPQEKNNSTNLNEEKFNENNIVEIGDETSEEQFTANTNTQGKRLPTLREMMNNISEEQTDLNKRVDNLQNDVTQIKGTLNEIRTALMYFGAGKLPEPVKGETPQKQPQTKTISDNSAKPKDFVILSDEAAVQRKPENNSGNQTKSQAPVAKRKPAAQAKPAVAPSNTVYEIKSDEALEKQPEQKPVETPAVITAAAEPDAEFNSAMNSFARNDYHDAIRKLSKIVETEKSQAVINDCNYWLGESYFGIKQYDKAIGYFRRVLTAGSTSKHDDAQAMIAESFIRAGQVQEAKNAFLRLLQNYPASEYVPRARRMLQQL